jgi:predicted sulfurtransferase
VYRYSTAKHIEADAYHEMLGQKDTVVIDVRNFYGWAVQAESS